MPKSISEPISGQGGDWQLCDLLKYFLADLGALQAAITRPNTVANPSASSAASSAANPSVVPLTYTLNAAAVQQQVLQLQQRFQQIIKLLADAALQEDLRGDLPGDLRGDQEQRLRPYQTEAHRLLRLMGVAALKLRAAKQPETLEQQRSLIETQLSQLQLFAQAIADEVCGAVGVSS